MRLLRKQRPPCVRWPVFFKNHARLPPIFDECAVERLTTFFYSDGGGDGLNQVVLVGRTTKDIELKYVGEKQQARAAFTLAVDRSYKNHQGQSETDFIRCVAWGKTAENMQKYCGKGSLIGVSGRLRSDSYMNQQQERVYVTEITVENVQFITTKEPVQQTDPLLDFQKRENALENLPF